jgi:hypothetical protein
MQPSKWLSQPIMTRNRRSNENWFSDWRACCGGSGGATAIESGLFKIQAKHLLQFRQRRRAHQDRQKIIETMYRKAVATEHNLRSDQDDRARGIHTGSALPEEFGDQTDNLTHAFVRLSNLPTYPLDRLSRYEATLWRQACQILFALQCLDRRKPWEIMRVRARRGGP